MRLGVYPLTFQHERLAARAGRRPPLRRLRARDLGRRRLARGDRVDRARLRVVRAAGRGRCRRRWRSSSQRRPPELDRFEGAVASFVTPRNVVYHVGGRDGRRLLRPRPVGARPRDRAGSSCRARSRISCTRRRTSTSSPGSASTSSRAGLPRLHAVGMSGPAGAVAVLMPSGGGKSTLALRALRGRRREADLRRQPADRPPGPPAPVPAARGREPGGRGIGAAGGRAPDRADGVPPQARDRRARVRRPDRDASRGRCATSCSAAARCRSCRRSSAPRGAAPSARCCAEAVVGVGLYQGMEFVLQRGARDVLGKVRPAGAARRVLRRRAAQRRGVDPDARPRPRPQLGRGAAPARVTGPGHGPAEPSK